MLLDTTTLGLPLHCAHGSHAQRYLCGQLKHQITRSPLIAISILLANILCPSSGCPLLVEQGQGEHFPRHVNTGSIQAMEQKFSLSRVSVEAEC